MDEQRRLNLIEAYLDNRLTAEDRQELEALLVGSPEMRTLFWTCMQQHAFTWELLAEARGRNLALTESGVRSREDLAATGGVARAAAAAGLAAGGRLKTRRQAGGGVRRPTGRQTLIGQRLFWTAAAALLLLTAGVVGYRQMFMGIAEPEGPAEIQPMATVAAIGDAGGILIRPAGSEPLAAGQPVFPGDVVKTTGNRTMQGASLQFADGTQLHLQPVTQLTLVSSQQGKLLDLFNGGLAAVVTAQPVGQPLIVTTPHARVQVVGTRFTLAIVGEATRLQVDEGKVRLVRTFDSQSVEVGAQQYVLAAMAGEVDVQAVTQAAAPPDEPHVQPHDRPQEGPQEEPRQEPQEPPREEPRLEPPPAPVQGEPLGRNELIGRITGIGKEKTAFEIQVLRAGNPELVGKELRFAVNWMHEGERTVPRLAEVRQVKELRVGDGVRIQYEFNEHYRFKKLKIVEPARREPAHGQEEGP